MTIPPYADDRNGWDRPRDMRTEVGSARYGANESQVLTRVL